MSNYEIEVECNAVAQTTGRLGTAIVNYRGHDYRIPLGASGITRDGVIISGQAVPKAVYDFAVKQYDALCKAHLARSA